MTAAVLAACQLNEPPMVIGNIPAMTMLVGDTEAVTLSAYFADPDGSHTLIYSAGSSDTDVAAVTVSGATLTVTATGPGTATITTTASDPDRESVSEWFTVEVHFPDTQPSFGAQTVADQTYRVGRAITPLVLPAATGGNDPLTYTLTPTVPGLQFAEANRTLRGTASAAGTHFMTYRVVDNDGDDAALTFTIVVDPDTEPPQPVATVGLTAAAEATEGMSVQFSVSLSAAVSAPVELSWSTADGTASAGSDYVAVSGQVVTILANATKATFSVATMADDEVEDDEMFTVRVTAHGTPPTGVTVPANLRATGTIRDDDVEEPRTATVGLTDAAEATEGSAVQFSVSLSAGMSAPVELSWSTADGTASAGSDYVAVSGQVVTILANATKATFSVATMADDEVEDDETFTVRVTAHGTPPTGVTVPANLRATGTIRDDDIEIPPDQVGSLLWSFYTDSNLISDPALGDDTIYVTSGDTLYALDTNGRLRWSFQPLGAGVGASQSGPVIGNDGTVYVGGSGVIRNRLYAVGSDGALRWSYDAGGSITGNPAIGADGTIYSLFLSSGLHAVARNGSSRWSVEGVGGGRSSPAIGADGTIYVLSYWVMGSILYAIDADGSIRWSHRTSSSNNWEDSGLAIGADGTIYVSTGSVLFAINTDGSQRWSFDLDVGSEQGRTSAPVIGVDGTVYVKPHSAGDLYAINANGTLRWTRYIEIGASSIPTIGADGTIYVSAGQYLHAIAPDSSPRWTFNMEKPSNSSPAIGSDGTVYVGAEGALGTRARLYAIKGDSKGLAHSSWPTVGQDVRRQGRVPYGRGLPPVATKYELTVTTTGALGTVTSDPDGIECGPSSFKCSALFDEGKTVTLTATPASGLKFARWRGSCSGTEPTCLVTMTEGHSATAQFVEFDALNLTIDGMYINQAIQKPDGTVPLVRGRDGLLRVFVRANDYNGVRPQVRVRFYQDGALTDTRLIDASGPPSPAPISDRESTLAASWNLRIPGASIVPGLSVVADVDPDDEIEERIETDNMFPRSGAPLSLDVHEVPVFRGRLVPVHQSALCEITGDVNERNKATYLDLFRRLYPLADDDVDVRQVYTTTAVHYRAVLPEIAQLRLDDGSARYYYGVMSSKECRDSFFAGGIGQLGGKAAVGADNDFFDHGTTNREDLYAHEVGHNFGRPHSPCGVRGDPVYPYRGGVIGHWGWDRKDGRLIDPFTADIMGYCDPAWISDYTYRGVLNYRERNDRNAPLRSQPVLALWGSVSDEGVTIEPAYVDHDGTVVEPEPGPYRLEGLDDSGTVLFSRSFTGYEVPDEDYPGLRHFSFRIPVSEAYLDRLAALRVRGVHHTAVLRSTTGGRAGRMQALQGGVDEVRLERLDRERVKVAWDRNRFALAIIRDPSGAVLSYARGGEVIVVTGSEELEVQLSDGVRSISRMVAVAGR